MINAISWTDNSNSLREKGAKCKFASPDSIFEKSRIYIGCSVSDGISTSFLEALAKGVYPIQTNTSCAGEWMSKGAVASLVNLNLQELESELIRALGDDKLLINAARENFEVTSNFLRSQKISLIAHKFYLEIVI